jgi:hypothetical protein
MTATKEEELRRTHRRTSGRAPGWFFRLEGLSDGEWVAEGRTVHGDVVCRSGAAPEIALERCVADAARFIRRPDMRWRLAAMGAILLLMAGVLALAIWMRSTSHLANDFPPGWNCESYGGATVCAPEHTLTNGVEEARER